MVNAVAKKYAGFWLMFVLGLLVWLGGAAPAAQGGGSEITDRAGRKVQAAAPFGRIISLYSAHTENLLALSLDAALIGVSPQDRLPPGMGDKPRFSYHDGAEKFLAAHPDLVLIRPMIDWGYAPLVRRLEQSGIVVVSLQPETVEDMYGYWRDLGALTGRQSQAETLIERFTAAVAAFRQLTAGITSRPRVYFEAIHEKVKTFTPGSIPIFALEAAGGRNVAADAAQVRNTNIAYYGKERLLSRAHEIDVFLAQRGAMNQPSVAQIAAEPGFGAIRAVRQGRICIVDEALVARPTPRLLLGINQIGNCLFPEIFGPRGDAIVAQSGILFYPGD
jgi:iron complex transport system substrate-binding protein